MRENGLMMQYFECFLNDDGGLWQALKADASRLQELGISAVWIPLDDIQLCRERRHLCEKLANAARNPC